MLSVVLSAAGLAQTAKPGRSGPETTAGVEERLKPLLAGQQHALAGGDSASIMTATRSLAAAALREMAEVRRREGEAGEAAELEQQAAALGGSSEGTSGSAQGGPAAVRRVGVGERRNLDEIEHRLREVLAASFNDLGTSEARQQSYAAALQDFLAAERWGGSTGPLLRNIGVAAFRLQNFAESTRALEAYAKTSPTDAPAREMLAMSEFSQGGFAAAAANFAAVPEMTERDARASYAWAFSLAHSGQQQRANEIARSLSAQSLPAENLALVCHVFMDTEAYEQAADCYRKAYRQEPSLKLAHYQVAESLLRLDRPAEAVPELRQELLLTPGDANVEYSLAYALLQTSQKDEARRLLAEVISADPANAQAQYQLGKLQLESGDLAGAVQHLEAAEINSPSSDYIHYQLQTAYRKAGRPADADRELRLYREIKAKARQRAPAGRP